MKNPWIDSVPFVPAVCFLLITSLPIVTNAQSDAMVSQRLRELESKVDRLEREANNNNDGSVFLTLYLFGVVFAMWAQRHGEDGCLWFILGFIPMVNIIAALAILSKGQDQYGRRG
ncbi:hypothetical protein [Symmachiella dynata]|uniref:hypothetical protein n=1 Tax=Symmachiella dynata TaxID=2527995 RepID=UPI0030EB1DA9